VQQSSSRKLCRYSVLVACLLVPIGVRAEPQSDFPALPLPPPVDGLTRLPKAHPIDRLTHVRLVRQEAQQRGLPPEVAEAVAQVESAYNPNAVGAVGEVGLMQVRPTTAAMLGHSGTIADLHEPSTNIRYGVGYLADAWKLGNGDLCRALMKYRAGQERFSERSVEYCRRARAHLASLGSPLANAPLPRVNFVPTAQGIGSARVRAAGRRLVARVSNAQEVRRPKSRQLWTAHDARMKAIMSKVSSASLRIAAGI